MDVNTISRALKIDMHAPSLPCINIYEKYLFDRRDFELYVGFFCDSNAPLGSCVENFGISFVHFLPIFQQLAIILRANLLPKPNNDQFFDFIDLKVMFQLVTNQVEFNISYVMILNMFLAYQLEYMPYGLFLTSIFELYHIPLPRLHADIVDFYDVSLLVKLKISLNKSKPYRINPIKVSPEKVTHDYVR